MKSEVVLEDAWRRESIQLSKINPLSVGRRPALAGVQAYPAMACWPVVMAVAPRLVATASPIKNWIDETERGTRFLWGVAFDL